MRKGAYISPICKPGAKKKKNSLFPYFSLFFLTDLFNMNRSGRQKYESIGNFRSFKKCAYIRPICIPGDEKKNFDFSILFFIFFLTVLILPNRVEKKIWIDREFQVLYENALTSDRYANPSTVKKFRHDLQETNRI